jgi:hypothetical protein
MADSKLTWKDYAWDGKRTQPTTEEQKLQFEAMDNEFEIETANSMGVVGREAIDADRARFIGDYSSRPMTAAGFYFYPRKEETSQREREEGAQLLNFRGGKARIIPEDDTVWVIGVDATPNTYAHEFRHRAFKKDLSESDNRLLDGYYASTPSEWETAVLFWRDNLYSKGWGLVELPEAEKDLISTLRRREDAIIDYEQQYIDGMKVPYALPTVRGWFGPRPGKVRDARRGPMPAPWKRWEAMVEAKLSGEELREDNAVIQDNQAPEVQVPAN